MYTLPRDFYHTERDIKTTAALAMDAELLDEPSLNATRLAENATWALDHDEWLDDPDHWIWELSLSKAQDE